MKRPTRFTMASFSLAVGAGIAALVFAAIAGLPWPHAAASAPEVPEHASSQRVVIVAQANQPSLRQAADTSALAQQGFANLGQLLDAGAKLISPQQFKEEVVQRMLLSMLSSGTVIEVIHTSSGAIAGNLLQGRDAPRGAPQNWPLTGSWTIDDSERICVRMQINYSQGTSMIPTRCQFWFKLGERYYVSDSDVDRSAMLLVRMLK